MAEASEEGRLAQERQQQRLETADELVQVKGRVVTIGRPAVVQLPHGGFKCSVVSNAQRFLALSAFERRSLASQQHGAHQGRACWHKHQGGRPCVHGPPTVADIRSWCNDQHVCMTGRSPTSTTVVPVCSCCCVPFAALTQLKTPQELTCYICTCICWLFAPCLCA